MAAAAVTLLSLPVVIPWAAQPSDFAFSGFLVNPIDGFSYLAKMRQGASGSWLFRLPYAADPGEGAFLFTFYLGLGHLQRLSGLDPLLVYHLARLAGALAMLAAAWAFLTATRQRGSDRRWGLVLIVFGSGLGWLGLAFGRLAIDLWVPEAIPIYAALANAHFPWAMAGVLMAFWALAAFPLALRSRLPLAAGAGLLLAIVQPFAILTVAGAGAVWLVWSRLRSPAERSTTPPLAARAWAWMAFVASAAPLILYDLWVTRSQPALAAWSSQNVTPTPPLIDVLLGFGLVLPLALAAGLSGRNLQTESGRLLIAWLGIGLLLVFLPLPLQRRMLLAVFFPMAALAGSTLAALAADRRRLVRLAPLALCGLSAVSTPLVMLGAVGAALQQEDELVLTRQEAESYRWIAENLPSDSLMLAGDVTGNRLPAFSDVRVIYGHPFETPQAEAELDWVRQAFAAPEGTLAETLRSRGVTYVYYGPREARLGAPPDLAGFQPVWRSGALTIFAVPPE